VQALTERVLRGPRGAQPLNYHGLHLSASLGESPTPQTMQMSSRRTYDPTGRPMLTGPGPDDLGANPAKRKRSLCSKILDLWG